MEKTGVLWQRKFELLQFLVALSGNLTLLYIDICIIVTRITDI
jgi:hypothetical protein